MKSIHNARNNNPSGQQQIPVSPDDLNTVSCKCGSTHFRQAHKIGKLSSLHPKNPTGEDHFVNFAVNVCLECGEVLDINGGGSTDD